MSFKVHPVVGNLHFPARSDTSASLIERSPPERCTKITFALKTWHMVVNRTPTGPRGTPTKTLREGVPYFSGPSERQCLWFARDGSCRGQWFLLAASALGTSVRSFKS